MIDLIWGIYVWSAASYMLLAYIYTFMGCKLFRKHSAGAVVLNAFIPGLNTINVFALFVIIILGEPEE